MCSCLRKKISSILWTQQGRLHSYLKKRAEPGFQKHIFSQNWDDWIKSRTCVSLILNTKHYCWANIFDTEQTLFLKLWWHANIRLDPPCSIIASCFPIFSIFHGPDSITVLTKLTDRIFQRTMWQCWKSSHHDQTTYVLIILQRGCSMFCTVIVSVKFCFYVHCQTF